MKTHYSMGFAFSKDLRDVVLIEKQKPDWMKGYWNGVGGHIEEGESPLDCMEREFREETGVTITTWEYLGLMEGEFFVMHLFRTCNNDIYKVRSTTIERVEVISTGNLINLPLMNNLRWLIPMAQFEVEGRGMPFTINEYQKTNDPEGPITRSCA
jgi:8-oxo-dGTP diphosphatase